MSKRPNPRKNPKKATKQNNDGNQENKRAGNDASPSAEVNPAPFKPEETQDEHTERSIRGPVIGRIRSILKQVNWWRVFEGIGILAGIGYAAVTLLQWRDLRHNFEVDQRAWLRFRYTILADKIDDKVVMNAWPLILQNVGKSPANNTLVNGQFEIVPKMASPSLSFGRPHTTIQVSSLFPTDNNVLPIALQSSSNKLHSLSNDEIEDLAAGRSYLAVFAQVTYDDPFGPHWTRFCTWKGFSENDIFAAQECVAWNATGDGPPPK